MLERADMTGFWQSVTGSWEPGEALADTAGRELLEETGIDARAHGGVLDWQMQHVFAIYPQYLHRYPAGTTHNTEHVYSLCVPRDIPVTLAPAEHTRYQWLPWQEATLAVRSWTNQAIIDALPLRAKSSAADQRASQAR